MTNCYPICGGLAGSGLPQVSRPDSTVTHRVSSASRYWGWVWATTHCISVSVDILSRTKDPCLRIFGLVDSTSLPNLFRAPNRYGFWWTNAM
jgi:hypothetical protein